MRGEGDGTSLADALIAEINRRGMRQRDAAEALGTSQQTLSKWLNGKHVPLPERRPQVAAFLGITPDELADVLPRHEFRARPSTTRRLNLLEDRVGRLANSLAELREIVETLAARDD